LQNQSFLYDMMGNVTQRQDGNLGLSENAFYDADYRLTSTQLNGTQNLVATYDAMGNVTSRSDIGAGATWTYDPTHKHRMTGIASVGLVYSYDSNGNVTSRSGGTITVANSNYPTSISVVSPNNSETVTLAYGPDRDRWQQQYTSVNQGNPSTTNYVGGLMEQVISGGITTYRHYIYAGSEPVAVYARNSSGTNVFNYFLSDHQGSVAAITANNGSLVIAESNTPFGARRNPSTWVNPTITATGWTGQVSDDDIWASTAVTQYGYTHQTMLGLFMELNHMNGRVQDAITGRFLSADPNIPDPAIAADYNRYSYVRNNPLTLIDPSGFDASPDCANPDCTEITVTANRYYPAGPGVNGAYLWLPSPDEIRFLNLAFLAIQAALEELKKPPKTTPCTGVGGAIQDFTGGQSNQSALDDIVDNYVETKSFGVDNIVDNIFGTHIAGDVPQIANPGVQTAIMLGGGSGVVAQAWGGQTLFQATSLAVRGASLGLNVPYAALAATGGVTFALGYLVKGTYSAGILAGSTIRTGANRLTSALCTRQ
jgi:RHS repeat-associated protein